MARPLIVTIRGRRIPFVSDTPKADIARTLLQDNAANYTVTEISKAVPMAYSQVHSIAQKMGRTGKPQKHFEGDLGPVAHATHRATSRGTDSAARRQAKATAARADQRVKETLEDYAEDIPTARQKAAKKKPARTSFQSPRVGKLRTGGYPSDIDVGECANCGHDLVVRQGGAAGWLVIHVNTTAEEYLGVTQFCNAVPKVLVE